MAKAAKPAARGAVAIVPKAKSAMTKLPATKSATAKSMGPKLRKEFKTAAFAKGVALRRAVLGAEYVDRSIANADDFTADFQKAVTEFAWGEIWARPGLERKQRSMLNLAMLTALNRPNELRLHLRGALNNGVSRDEIKEILLHASVYCGVPAALDGFKLAVEVFKEIDSVKVA